MSQTPDAHDLHEDIIALLNRRDEVPATRPPKGADRDYLVSETLERHLPRRVQRGTPLRQVEPNPVPRENWRPIAIPDTHLPRPTQHRIGVLSAPTGAALEVPIAPASPSVAGHRIELQLDQRVVRHPRGNQKHEVMVTLRAKNPVDRTEKSFAYSQVCDIPPGQSGDAMSIGLSVGGEGTVLQFSTMNIRNGAESALLTVLKSGGLGSMLQLLRSGHPALEPLLDLAFGVAEALLSRTDGAVKNVRVASTRGLRYGSFVAVQSTGPIDWSRYVYDQRQERVVDAVSRKPLQHSYLIRVSPAETAH